MQINPSLPVVEAEGKAFYQTAVCVKTGISFEIAMQSLPAEGKTKWNIPVLEFQSPFGYWSNTKAFCHAPRAWLEECKKEHLAGLVVAAYTHYGLIEAGQLNAVELNKIFATASSGLLVDLLKYADRMNDKVAAGLPCLLVEWADMKEHSTAESLLKAYSKRLLPYFNDKEKEQQRIAAIRASQTQVAFENVLKAKGHEGRILAGGTYLSSKQTQSGIEKEFEETLKANKRRMKAIAKTMLTQQVIGDKLAGILHSLSINRNLVIMSDELRTKIIAKMDTLAVPEAKEVSEILKASRNPYDIFASEELDRASDSFVDKALEAPRGKLTIAEILAKKRAGEAACSRREETEANSVEADEEPLDTDEADEADEEDIEDEEDDTEF